MNSPGVVTQRAAAYHAWTLDGDLRHRLVRLADAAGREHRVAGRGHRMIGVRAKVILRKLFLELVLKLEELLCRDHVGGYVRHRHCARPGEGGSGEE